MLYLAKRSGFYDYNTNLKSNLFNFFVQFAEANDCREQCFYHRFGHQRENFRNMNYGAEITIYADLKKYHTFFTTRVATSGQTTNNLHWHPYAEFHIVESGAVAYVVGDKHYLLHAGDMLVIPARTFHRNSTASEESATFISFQIDKLYPEPMTYSQKPELITELASILYEAFRSGNCGVASACLSYSLGPLLCKGEQKVIPLQNKHFIIHEWFTLHYADDVTLADLARELSLSPSQTQRLIKKYTGCTFRQMIIKKRMDAAKHLYTVENLSMEEIAYAVGYHSYNGFWKAFRNTNHS